MSATISHEFTVESLEELHQNMKCLKPPSRRQWILWIGGIVMGVVLIIASMATFIVSTRIDAKTSATSQSQSLQRDIANLRKVSVQSSARVSKAYGQIEVQLQELCATIPGCNWNSIK